VAWVGIAMVLVGGVLVYSAVKGLDPWTEFTSVLATGKTQRGTSVAGGPAPPTKTV